MNAFGAIVSIPHLTLKYPLDEGKICTVRTYQKVARECYVTGLKVEPWAPRQNVRHMKVAMTDLDPRSSTEDRMESLGKLQPWSWGQKKEQYTFVGRGLTEG